MRQLARAVYVNPGHISNLRNGKARPSPGLAAELDGPRLAGMAGGAMLLLGDTRAARTLIAEALTGRATGDAKGRALLTLDLAECMATEREPEQAADLCAQAIGMTGGNVVLPVMTRAATVHSALQPWSRTRAVLELEGQLADLKVAETEE